MVDARWPGAARRVWTVAALLHAVSDALASRFGACTVRGELSGFSRAPSGHCYFCLKDTEAHDGAVLMRCAMFRRASSLLGFEPADGQEVELRGRVAVYEPRGELQFVVEAMQPVGAGAMYERFVRLKARLEAEGLFAAGRKRAPARYPRRVGVVTSLAAAALHDVLSSLARRAPHVAVVVYPAAVQGAAAPDELAQALAAAALRREVDTLILCRGGGSAEDLWAFNDERVVRAIAASPIPLVSGVGHETDVTLSDFAADLRAPTPTAAAELAVPSLDACALALGAAAVRLQRSLRHTLEAHAQRVDSAGVRLARSAAALRRGTHALALLAQRLAAAAHQAAPLRRARLDQQQMRLRLALAACLSSQSRLAQTLDARLRALDPARVLKRGYAWLVDESGRPVSSVAQMAAGQRLNAVLADGAASVQVLRIEAAPEVTDPT